MKERGMSKTCPVRANLRVLSTLPSMDGGQNRYICKTNVTSPSELLCYNIQIARTPVDSIFLPWQLRFSSEIKRSPQVEIRVKGTAVTYRDIQPEGNSGRTRGNRATREQRSASACPARIAPEGKPGRVHATGINTFSIPVEKRFTSPGDPRFRFLSW